MKKIIYLFLLLVAVKFDALTAQNQVLNPTTYLGALDENANNDWTNGWTNWNPKTTAYYDVNDTTTLDGLSASLPVPGEKKITGTLTLDASKVYQLRGIIVVTDGSKLVIPAGTVIRAISDLNSSPKNYAVIVVERGGKIEATGTANNPVVLTSTKAVGSRERGDWGGILIAGRSYHNLANGNFDNVQMEGFNNVTFDASLAKFGGNNPLDNSGILRYVRIEFAGLAFEANKEINGLTLGSVGSGTEINYVQVSYSNDDSFEWFGGTVNSKHLIAFKGTDDDFDTDNGYSGVSQFGIGIRDSAYFDLTYALASGASTSEGFESDNEATGTANVQPYTNAIFSNFTMIGPVPVGSKYSDMNATTKAAFRRGARIRRNSSLRIVNSIFMGYRNFVMIDGDSSVRNTNYPAVLNLLGASAVDQSNKQIFFSNNLIVNTGSAFTSTTDTTANGLVEVARANGSGPKLNALNEWLRQAGCTANKIDPVAFTAGTVLENPMASSSNPVFRPVANSPALSGADFSCNPVIKNFVSSIQEINKALKGTVYPNPAQGGFIKFGKQVDSYGLFDVKGQLIKFGMDTDQMSVEGIHSGIYFIKLDGHVQKLILQ
ncbi:MAG: T9SS type A sorting domain-containing protein [Saprospiraceae bacterium]